MSCAFFRLLFGFCLASSVMPMFSMQRVKKIVRQLKGASEHAKDIFDAIDQQHLESIKYWLDKGISLGVRDEHGETPLIRATRTWNLDLVRYLVKEGADKEAKNSQGMTALMLAAQFHKIPMVQYLVEEGADKDAKNNEGKTAIQMAMLSFESFNTVKYLLEQGAAIDSKTVKELIEEAQMYSKFGLLRLLEDRGFDVDLQLNALGFDPNQRNRFGITRLMEALKNNDYESIEFLIKQGANPYQDDNAGFNAFDYAEGNEEALEKLNKTMHKAPNVPTKKEDIVERDNSTSKAIRRLQHIQRAMNPEPRKTIEEEEKTVAANVLQQGEPTQTEAHWKQFGKAIINEYGNVLADPLVKKALAREKEAIAQGKYVFYRSEPGKYRLYEYFLEELYRLVNLYSTKSEFVWNRFFKDAAKEKTINQYIDTLQSRAHKIGPQFNVLLSANISLFGNVNNHGDSTWYFFLNNFEATVEVQLSAMFKHIFDKYRFDEKYIGQLLALRQGALEQAATLQQIIIPKNIVDDVVMFAKSGYCFPWETQVDKGQADSCWDPNAISGDLDGRPKKGRYTCISSIIDKYRDGRIAIDDAYQVRILMNAVYGLNPESGIEIYQYTRLPEKKLQHFKTQVQKITDEMFAEWLKEQLNKKEVPESIKDEKLGGVLQYLGKGRKEPVKSKL